MTASYTAPNIRITQIDALRGFAVLGIYVVNIYIFALPYSMDGLVELLDDNSALNRSIYFIHKTFLEGSMRALFSMLFGASALIFLSEARLAIAGTDLVDHYYRRTLLLMLFGAVHAYLLLWPYDVLYTYGLLGLFLFPLRKLSARALFVAGVLLLFVGDIKLGELAIPGNFEASLSTLDVADDGSVTDEQEVTEQETAIQNNQELESRERTKNKEKKQQYIDQLEVEKEVALYRSGYGRIFTAQIEMVVIQHTAKIYLSYFYDIGGMMLVGMALFRSGVLSGRLGFRHYFVMAILCLALGVGTKGMITMSEIEKNEEMLAPLAELGIGYNITRLFMALGYVGLVGCIVGRLNFLQKGLCIVGRMALTSYIMQTILSVLLFYGPGLGMFASMQRYELLLVVLGVWIFQVAFSSVWLVYYRQGPLEWLWRCMIYGSWLTNRKSVIQSA